MRNIIPSWFAVVCSTIVSGYMLNSLTIVGVGAAGLGAWFYIADPELSIFVGANDEQ